MLANTKHGRIHGVSLTDQQLVDEDSYGPPVALPAVVTIAPLRLEHLRGDVVWSAHGCVTVHHACLQTQKHTRFTTEGRPELNSSDNKRLVELLWGRKQNK